MRDGMTEPRLLNRAYVEIGNVCNLSCSFCPGTRRAKRQMTEEEYRRVLSELRPYTDYVYLHVMGEPLLHRLLDRFLAVAEEYGFRVCITTNGTLLRERGKILLAHSRVIHKVSVSLHSMEGNGREAEEAYLDDVCSFAEQAAAPGCYTVLRLWNLDADGRHGENAENERIESYLRARFGNEWIARWNGYRLKERIFLEYAGIFTWPTESNAEDEEDGYCHGLLDQIAILADGSVVPCCLDSEGEIVLGNLYGQTLSEILASDRAERIRAGFRNGRMVEPLCKKCTYARRFDKH